MHVLFANHQLVERAGSELYTLELATAVRDRGHRVSVFTFDAGPIAQQLQRQGIPVFGPGDAATIGALDCDLAHVHHAPCLYFLGATRLKCPVVYSVLGVVPALEGPPLAWAGIARVLAVSEEVRDGLGRSPLPPTIVRNWFDDRGPMPALSAAGQIERVAVVSNHLDPSLKAGLDVLAARRPGFSWHHFGLPSASADVTPELLAGFDAVITIGRTALLAAALGKPCLLYDVHGCDGVLDALRLDALATRNFSGRLQASRPSIDELEQLLFVQTRRVDLEALAIEVRGRFGLRQRVDEILALHREAAASGIALGGPEAAFARAGEVHAEAMAQVTPLRHALAASEEGRRLLHAELNDRTSELEVRDELFESRGQRLARLWIEHEEALERGRELTFRLAQQERELELTRTALDLLKGSAGVQLIEAAKRIPGVYATYLALKQRSLRATLPSRVASHK
jgi:hypothetical protein